ncbi:Ig-like domain-containing protein [Hymenobacter lutimineralis]|uniref:Ig-like domain-containing protein n=1 Tax=Hymenobacter lutimineralis TaxID=2606448 RepID=UPI001654EC97|nr:hypothetical protein [Hymenobacter lutimineralis]
MKNWYSLLSLLSLLLWAGLSTSYGQCSGKLDLIYPTTTGTATLTVNNGNGSATTTTCPTTANGGAVLLSFNGDSDSNILVEAITTVNGVQQTTTVQSYSNVPAYTVNSITVTPSTTTTYRVTATTTACQQTKTTVASISVTPSLRLSATNNVTTICSGTSTVLTATGGVAVPPATQAVYTFSGPGITTQSNTTGTLTVTPTVTSTYTVTTNTASCGTATQQITLVVPTLTVTPAAPGICAGSPTTLTAASNLTGGTYTWTIPATGTTVGTGAAITVSPTATTTYRVTYSGTTCTNAQTRDVTVTVTSTPTLAVTPTSATTCGTGSTVLTASSNITGGYLHLVAGYGPERHHWRYGYGFSIRYNHLYCDVGSVRPDANQASHYNGTYTPNDHADCSQP